MSSVSTIYKILDADVTLETKVADRVYIGNYPTSEGDVNARPITPYVILEEITTVPLNTMKGNGSRERAILQIDIVGAYKAIKEIRDIIRTVLKPYGYEVESGSKWEEEVRNYRETMEWSFWLPR